MMPSPVPSVRPRVLLAAVPFAVAAVVAWAAAADFPKPYDSEKDKTAKPLPADEAARKFQVPDGFSVEVFAAEPDVRNPIAMTWDTRGRLWVAENLTYAEREVKFARDLRDRVLIFHDKDGDGKPEETKTFLDDAQRLTGIEVGLGGVWLMCPPQVLFVPDKDGDDKPDGPPQVVLEGFDIPAENHHNLANGLKWGPDGWLYGRCGASAPGKVRRPDQSPDAAIPLAGGIWRYHPKTKVFEPLCHGTTNPWGHDWNEYGDGFFVNTVNGHLWQIIPGAHYRRPHTISPNPLVYEPIDMIADHWHFDTGKDWTASRDPEKGSGKFGGGHAHSGATIYLGDQWPKEYRGKLLTLNFHGRRVNVERLERSGSGYVGKHEPDMLQSADPFFRGIDLSYGPDGSVYVLDWSDTGECHENTGVHRNSGRIFRVTYGRPKPVPKVDLTKATAVQLVKLHGHKNEWYVRQARRELANRTATGQDLSEIKPDLMTRFEHNTDSADRLKSLFTLATLGMTTHADNQALFSYADQHSATWAVRLLADEWLLDSPDGRVRSENMIVPEQDVSFLLVRQALNTESGLVRQALASTLQRLPTKHRPALAAALLSRSEDAVDPNIPFLVWYGLIPVVQADPMAVVPLAAVGNLPKVREWTARRFAEIQAKDPRPLDALLARTADKPEAARRDVVVGLTAGLAGVRKATPPPAWKTFPKEFTGPDAARFKSLVQNLDVVFGDGRALDEVRRVALDGKADLAVRKAALQSLIEANPPDLRAVCEGLLKVRFLNTVALRGLTRFDDPAVGKFIAANYRTFHPSERSAVVEALASRPTFAAELLDQMTKGTIPRSELSAFQARQIRSFDKPDLTKRLAAVWGELRDSPKDKTDLITKLKAELTPAVIAAGNKSRGRATFAQTCATCHRLYGAGGEIGPDLTGAGRKDLDYLLSNIVDPSAVVNKDFQMTVLSLADGRVVNGIVVGRTPQAVTVQTDKDRIAIPKDDIESEKSSPLSLMPDGLIQPFAPEQVRDLIAYLMTDTQVELP